MDATKRTARLAGLLYLVVIIGAGFAEGAVRSTLVVPGDAAATAASITASEMLFRAGFAADLVAFLGDLGVTVLLYVLLAPVHRTAALAMAAFRLVAHPAIGALNLLNHFAALQLLGGGDSLAAFDPTQLQALALLALDAHGTGYLIAGAFFGVHLALLGWLLARSELFPSLLGALILAAAVGYLVESFGMFLFPAGEGVYGAIVTLTAVLGELSFCGYLLVKGVRSSGAAAPTEPVVVAAGGTRGGAP
jgi:Domain of unknown function (DUF4386)